MREDEATIRFPCMLLFDQCEHEMYLHYYATGKQNGVNDACENVFFCVKNKVFCMVKFPIV